MPGETSSTDVVCRRTLLPESGIWKWHSIVTQAEGEQIKDVRIIALSADLQGVAHWELSNAWPSRITYVYENGELIEEVVLVSSATRRLFGPDLAQSVEPPAYGMDAGAPANLEMASGYVVAQKAIDVSGPWQSSIGLTYLISQKGNEFSYQDPLMQKLVQGTVDGEAIKVSWVESGALQWLEGTIVSPGPGGMAAGRIEWDNGVAFFR